MRIPPMMEVATSWLERNRPMMDHVSVVHGDYRSGNFMFGEDSARIAWLDWERGYLGDRHRDLAWTTQAMFGYPRRTATGTTSPASSPRTSSTRSTSRSPAWTSTRTASAGTRSSTATSARHDARQDLPGRFGGGKNHQEALMVVLKADAALPADRLRRLLDFLRQLVDHLYARARFELQYSTALATTLRPMLDGLAAADAAALDEATARGGDLLARPGAALEVERAVLHAAGELTSFERSWYLPLGMNHFPSEVAQLDSFLAATAVPAAG